MLSIMFALNNIGFWFYGKDILIDIFSSVVILLIFLRVITYYRIKRKEIRYKYLLYSFGFLALSFLLKIFTHAFIYYNATETRHVGLITVIYQTLVNSDLLLIISLFLYRIFSILAFYFLYLVYAGKQPKYGILLTVYLILLMGYLSHFEYYIFHLTSFVFLGIISLSILSNYSRVKFRKTAYLADSFIIIMLSQGFFMLLGAADLFYILGEIIQLCGYIMLLFIFMTVLRDGKKKR